MPITPDSQPEQDEFFLISLNDGPSVNLSPTNGQSTITILNDDCETLPDPFGGQVTLSGTSNGSVATYMCDLELIGGECNKSVSD